MMTMIRSEESNNENNFTRDFLQKNVSGRKQPAANFFDYEDEEGSGYELTAVSGHQDHLSYLNNKDITRRSISVQLSLSEVTSIKNKHHSAGEDKKQKDKLIFHFDEDINQRITQLIESTVNSIVNLSSSSTSTNSPNSSGSLTSASTKFSLSTRQAVDRIFTGDIDHVNLSLFRGKEQKLELLDYAVLTGDKYTITVVTIFLEHTLKSSVFFYEVIRRPVAADHYLIYLRSTEQLDQQLNVLNMMGRYEDAAFVMYSRAVKSSSEPQQKIKLLERAMLNFTTGGPEVTQWQSYIREHITLLEHQLPIEADDQRRCEEALKQQSTATINYENFNQSKQSNIEDNQLFVIYHPRPCLLGLPLMETLRYCYQYHHHLPENNFASPFHLKKTFNITDRQFLWIALQTLAKTLCWQEIDNLFEYKSWLGSRKIRRNIIPITDIVQVLYQNSSPPEMLEKYLDLVDDVEQRLQLAKEFHMNKYAADILIKLRDRKRLSELLSIIRTKSEVDNIQRYINNALVSSVIKWKN